MAKLYAPYIEGTLPAFYTDTGTGVTKLTVPFSLNRGVGVKQISNIALKFKTAQNSTYLYSTDTATGFNLSGDMYAYFNLPSTIVSKIKTGQYYKVQIAFTNGYDEDEIEEEFDNINLYSNYRYAPKTTSATTEFKTIYQNYIDAGHRILEQIGVAKVLSAMKVCILQEANTDTTLTKDDWTSLMLTSLAIDDKEVGYYSTVGIIKYTTKPVVTIAELDATVINAHNYIYTGLYSQEGQDITEKVYNYKFDIYNNKGELYKTSGLCLHNSSKDINNYDSYDEFTVSDQLEENVYYYIKYTIITNNNLSVSSQKYKIMRKTSIDPEIKTNLIAELNQDEAYIKIRIEGIKDDDGLQTPATGTFLLSRSCSDTNYSVWEEINRFKLSKQFPTMELAKDFTLEQGKSYQYALQQYNENNIYSNKILTEQIYVNFEDAFLYDGTRQLKIKYNPKISTFKKDVLEAKIDTIGSKYPFIFRNGNVGYKEFSISGLISYLIDENELFLSTDELVSDERITDLTNNNIANERIFKLEVLDWLTNGEVKLFRSPTEGNYLIRLINTSLSPNDTVGRMLHTFTSTAYEIAECNYENLHNFNILNINDVDEQILQFATVNIVSSLNNGSAGINNRQLNVYPAYNIQLEGLLPGVKIDLIFNNDKDEDDNYINKQTIIIGSTGSYSLNINTAIEKICIPDSVTSTRGYEGTMTYSYYSQANSNYDKINDIEVVEIPDRQFIGKTNLENTKINIVNEIEDIKTEFITFYNLDFALRNMAVVYYDNTSTDDENDRYYEDAKLQYYAFSIKDNQLVDAADITKWDPYSIYCIKDGTGVITKYYDSYNSIFITGDNINSFVYDTNIYINDESISLETTGTYTIPGPINFDKIEIGNGILANCKYQILTKTYNIENTNSDVLIAKNAYETELNRLKTLLQSYESLDLTSSTLLDSKDEQIEQSYKILPELYSNFINVLEENLDAEG